MIFNTARMSAWFLQKNMVDSKVFLVIKAKVKGKVVVFSSPYGVSYHITSKFIKQEDENGKQHRNKHLSQSPKIRQVDGRMFS